jgi:hypothetical protein
MEGLTRLDVEPFLTFDFLVTLQGTTGEGTHLNESFPPGLNEGYGLCEHDGRRSGLGELDSETNLDHATIGVNSYSTLWVHVRRQAEP